MNRIAKFLALDELDDDTAVYGSLADGQYVYKIKYQNLYQTNDNLPRKFTSIVWKIFPYMPENTLKYPQNTIISSNLNIKDGIISVLWMCDRINLSHL